MAAKSTTRNSSLRNKGNYLRTVLFAVPPIMELDIVGPMSVFAAANRICGQNDTGY